MLLTIGIPVFNGEKSIIDTLNSILKWNFNEDEVEIIVSDNASTDGTLNCLHQYPKVKVFAHTENVGFDRNLDRIFRYAKGKFVWTIGADDLLVSDKIETLGQILREHNDCGVIFVGGDNTCKDNFCEFSDAETFLKQSGFRSSFFSNNIIAKDLWLSSEIDEFIGSGWIHYAVILQVLLKGKSLTTNNQFVIENPHINVLKTWNNNGAGIIITLKLVEIFEAMKTRGYTKTFVNNTKKMIMATYPRGIIVAKLRGLKISRPVLLQFIKLFHEFPLFWIVNIWFLLLPSFCYQIIAMPLRLAKIIK